MDGDDIYQELLYRKGAALYNILDYHAAEHVLAELCKIDPQSELYRRTFCRNRVDAHRYKSQRIRGATIGMFLLVGVVIGVELLIVRPFFQSYIDFIEMVRNCLFAFGLSSIIFQELRIRVLAKGAYRALVLNK